MSFGRMDRWCARPPRRLQRRAMPLRPLQRACWLDDTVPTMTHWTPGRNSTAGFIRRRMSPPSTGEVGGGEFRSQDRWCARPRGDFSAALCHCARCSRLAGWMTRSPSHVKGCVYRPCTRCPSPQNFVSSAPVEAPQRIWIPARLCYIEYAGSQPRDDRSVTTQLRDVPATRTKGVHDVAAGHLSGVA